MYFNLFVNNYFLLKQNKYFHFTLTVAFDIDLFYHQSASNSDKKTRYSSRERKHYHIVPNLTRFENEHSDEDLPEIMKDTAADADTDLGEPSALFQKKHHAKAQKSPRKAI